MLHCTQIFVHNIVYDIGYYDICFKFVTLIICVPDIPEVRIQNHLCGIFVNIVILLPSEEEFAPFFVILFFFFLKNKQYF